jgi:FkbM family methyltransferase
MTSTSEVLTRGWALHQAGDLAGAEKLYRQALQADATDANAWCYLGMACHDQDRLEEAAAAYRHAIQLRPNFPVAFNNLGNTLRLQRRLQESLASFDRALQLKPDYVNAHKNKGTALVWEGHLDEALVCYQKALEYDPHDAETHKNLGVIWLLQGRFADGWREYEWRWKTSEVRLPACPQPLWDGTSLDGRSILLVAEQGLGDAVHFVRYAARLKERYRCRVIVACPKPLLPLLASCPGIDELVAQGDPPPASDVFAPLLNVPGILGDTAETFPASIPYLFADPQRVAEWKNTLAAYAGYRVGIAWQGNPQHQADRMRSVPLSATLPLGQLAGVQLFSLQKGPGVEQLEELGGRLNVVHLGDRLDATGGAFLDTAAVLQHLDLLITSDTAIAHVAGALGTPVWLALSYVPDWRWLLNREDTPWYPTMRLFRQPAIGDWASVFQRMAAEVAGRSPDIRPRRPEQYRLASSGLNRLVHARSGLMLYNRHDIYIGRSLEQYGEFSEGEPDLFRQLVKPGNVVVEAGANIGVHTLVLSELVAQQGLVYAFEPQRVIFQTLCANMALNSRTNVHCRAEALGASPGWTVIPPLDYHRPNNFGGLALGNYQQGERVAVITLDSLQLPRCDFLKADVEGMEQSVLEGARETIARHRPLLYVENDRREKSASLIEFILSLGYNLYWHLPRMFNPTNYFRNETNEFGNIVSVNMLGVHRSVKASIQGLRPIESPTSDWQTG